MDRLFRGVRFIDLHKITRQSLRASVERYGLKELEPFFGFQRETDLGKAGIARRRLESALELGRRHEILPKDQETVEAYNREDCLATWHLREWLENIRQSLIDSGEKISRPPCDRAMPMNRSMRSKPKSRRCSILWFSMYRLRAPNVPTARMRSGFWAHSLDYYRRERNVSIWEFYAHREVTELDEALRDRKMIGGLAFRGMVPPQGKQRKPRFEFQFPRQEVSIKEKDKLHTVGGDTNRKVRESLFGTVVDVDNAKGLLLLTKDTADDDLDPSILFAHPDIRTKSLEESVLALGQWVVDNDIDSPGRFRAARDLLLRRPPRLSKKKESEALRREQEEVADAALRVASDLDHSLLAIQGPPGAGKSYTGSKLIIDLVRQGKKVGVTAVSHKVILNLLGSTLKEASRDGVSIEVCHSGGEKSDFPDGVVKLATKPKAHEALSRGSVVGGTAWLWSTEDFVETLDYLIIDEAGQMSLANVLAVSRATKNLILLGDPAQLEQPQQGAHPEGTHISALEHLLGEHKTMPKHLGLFLDKTRRLHPKICALTSELYYDSRLEPLDGLEKQVISGESPFAGAGLFYAPVRHSGNQNSSHEEVDAVKSIVAQLLDPGLRWFDHKEGEKELTTEDILIVAPYNAQIDQLKTALPSMRIGTVDKFQGQEAAVVIYSMTSSSPEDAPRGMSFLYDPNRLNVATSRARCSVILVASPALFEPDCRSPEQIRWANGLCRFRELAAKVSPVSARSSDSRA